MGATRSLVASHHCVSISGIGLVKSWDGPGGATLFDDWHRVKRAGEEWDFSKWPADVVVINLGQNDHWLGVSEGEMISAYISFASKVRLRHQAAAIIMALGCMDAVSEGSPMRKGLEEAVSKRQADGDRLIHEPLFIVLSEVV